MIFKSDLDTKWVLIVDCFTSDVLLDLTSRSGTNKVGSSKVLERLYVKYPFFKDIIGGLDTSHLSIITFGEVGIETRDLFKHIDGNRYTVYSDISKFETSVDLIPMGRNMLYALTKNKGILAQVNKTKHISIDLGDKHVKKYEVIPTYSLDYIHYNSNVIPNFYNTFTSLSAPLLEYVKHAVIPKDAVKPLLQRIGNDASIKHIYLDIETEDLSYSKVLCVSIDYDNNKLPAFCIPIYNEDTSMTIKELLKKKPIIGHNLKFDVSHLVHAGIVSFDDVTIKDDTILLSYFVYNKSLGGLSLKFLAKTLLPNVPDWEAPVKQYLSKYHLKSYKEIPNEVLFEYAALDAYYTKLLYNKLITKLPKRSVKFYHKMIKIEKMISQWEYKGVKMDSGLLHRLSGIIKPNIKKCLINIHEMVEVKKFEEDVKHPINLNSPKQLALLAGVYLNIDNPYLTKSGNQSFKSEALEYLSEYYSTIGKHNKRYSSISDFLVNLLEYKNLRKFETSYLNKILKDLPEDDIYHTSFNMTGTITGRLSSFFHTLPNKKGLGNSFKRAVVPHDDNYIYLSADYSQAEPRVSASLSNDPLLIQSYKNGNDLYKYIYSQSFNIDYKDVTQEQRGIMKIVVLAISYGMGVNSLSKRLNVSKSKASDILFKFYDKFKEFSKWRKSQIAEVKQSRLIVTPFGREFSILEADNNKIDKIAVNYLVQSSTADLCLDSFYEFDNLLKNYRSFTVGAIHDSVETEVFIPELPDILTLTDNYFNRIANTNYNFLRVPLKMEIDIGTSFGGTLTLDKLDSRSREYTMSGIDIDYYALKDKLSKHYTVKDEILESTDYQPDKFSILADESNLKQVKVKMSLS